jgi:hypothetical protein
VEEFGGEKRMYSKYALHERGNVGQDEHEDGKLRFDFDSCQANLQ